MGARIVHDWPPNIAAIEKAFPLSRGVIFSWAPNTIFNPHKVDIPPELIAHERVHWAQQDGDPERWWARYIEDAGFRLEQEVEAHRAEWRAFRQMGKSPKRRRRRLRELAARLASPLYGGLVSVTEATDLVLGATPKQAA